MSEEFNQEQMDYFAVEDQAIHGVAEALAKDPWNIPAEKINVYISHMQQSGTAAIAGEGFRIVRRPETFFEIVPDESSHEDDEIAHAA